ncbi:MAG: tRNA (adenosine(37)-N6)-threonylcarbamoyltransferase complex dimerization subunit type 1 TsaB [Planctomycetes bacterium]|nr:tRNA (adenosine(37)-N6)-threonylcarbamoyltransferase complex dimerization subunit type 1 TsaB [Planctomycetota bacterium]
MIPSSMSRDRFDRSKRPYVLAFETSGAMGSVALGCAGEILSAKTFSRPRAHAAEFLPTIDDLCRRHGVEPHDVGCVYVSSGPGSFTGLRIAVTAARTIAFATGALVVGVPTLEVIAQNAAEASPQPTEVAVLLDAKRGRFFAATFRLEPNAEALAERGPEEKSPPRYVPTSDPSEVDPESFLAATGNACAVIGEGIAYHRECVDASNRRILPEGLYRPRAEIVFRLGDERALRDDFDDPRTLTPLYIRPPEAEEVWARRHEPTTGSTGSTG